MEYECDALVIGAGIVGAACAQSLSKRGMRVLVVDSLQPGMGTTAACMGHLVVMDDSESQMDLTSYSLELWREMADELPFDCDYSTPGTLWIAADEEEMIEVKRKNQYYGEWGIATQEISEKKLRELEPHLREGLAGALLVPQDAVVYAPNCVRWLLNGINFQGNTTIRSLESGKAVNSGGDTYKFQWAVLAAGTTTASLLPEVPVVPRKGHLAITERYPGYCKHQVIELGYLKTAHKMTKESVAFNLHPRPGGQILIGSSRELNEFDKSINLKIIQKMLKRACEYSPSLAHLKLLRTWVGFRPSTADKLPLIGPWPLLPGIYLATGHEGLGVTTALATGELIADSIQETKPKIDDTPFRPSRVLESTH